jgi:hypothetical protein
MPRSRYPCLCDNYPDGSLSASVFALLYFCFARRILGKFGINVTDEKLMWTLKIVRRATIALDFD